MKQINANINTNKIVMRSLITYGCLTTIFFAVIVFIPYPGEVTIKKYQFTDGHLNMEIDFPDLISLKEKEDIEVWDVDYHKFSFKVIKIHKKQTRGFNVLAIQSDTNIQPHHTLTILKPVHNSLFKVLFGK